MDPEVDAYLMKAVARRDEMTRLRSIALDCGLSESLKWGKPRYRVAEGGVAIIQPFKTRCAFMFFKGALLDDPDGFLEAPGPNSRAARRMMFDSVEAVDRMAPHLRAFIEQAVRVEEAGLRVEVRRAPEPVPDERVAMFDTVPGLKTAFEALTPGRQRGYLLHFSGARQSKTRTARIEKHVPRILEGRGIHD